MNHDAWFGVIVEDASGDRTLVSLDSEKKRFGQWPVPRNDVQLRDNLVARFHFEVRWNPAASTHEIQDYGQVYSPTVNGDVLRRETRLLQPGDVVAIGGYTLRYVDLEKVAAPGRRSPLEDMFRWPPDVERDPATSIANLLNAINSHELTRIWAAISPHYRSPSLSRVGDADRREDVLAVLRDLFAAFPDFQLHADEMWQLGTEHYVSLQLVGTFVGGLKLPMARTLPPTGARYELHDQVFVFRCMGGRIVNMRPSRTHEMWSAIERTILQTDR